MLELPDIWVTSDYIDVVTCELRLRLDVSIQLSCHIINGLEVSGFLYGSRWNMPHQLILLWCAYEFMKWPRRSVRICLSQQMKYCVVAMVCRGCYWPLCFRLLLFLQPHKVKDWNKTTNSYFNYINTIDWSLNTSSVSRKKLQISPFFCSSSSVWRRQSFVRFASIV